MQGRARSFLKQVIIGAYCRGALSRRAAQWLIDVLHLWEA